MLYQEEKQAIRKRLRLAVVRMVIAVGPSISEMMDTVRTRHGELSQEPQNQAECDEASAVPSGPAAV